MRKEDTKIFRIGETSINCQGIKMEIIAYRKCNDIDILGFIMIGLLAKFRPKPRAWLTVPKKESKGKGEKKTSYA